VGGLVRVVGVEVEEHLQVLHSILDEKK